MTDLISKLDLLAEFDCNSRQLGSQFMFYNSFVSFRFFLIKSEGTYLKQP
jgi:hypothetical protein